MRVHNIDSPQPGFLNRVPPGLKLAAALLILLGTALLPRRVGPPYLLPASLLLCLWPFSRMPLGYALKRLVLVEFFILGIGLLSLLRPEAFPALISAVVKSNLCVFTMLLLTWTTPFQEILRELRRLRLPAVMLTTLALMYRYLPVLADESRRMQRARASRTFSPSRRLAWRSLSVIIAHLFIRSIDRAERIYLAMCARGWK
ncbi:MAG TPA: CbiQ family ECF transporter T component [Verrucomicrobiae bacterium]|nr:CbiQ family ECF transporter T component [Verrucomicrobiae bacterium]